MSKNTDRRGSGYRFLNATKPAAPTRGGLILKTTIFFIALIALWALAATLINKPLILPVPWEVVARLFALAITVPFWTSIAFSLMRIASGFAAGMLLGSLLALFMHRHPTLTACLTPLIKIVQATPIVSFIIIALIWFSSDYLPIIIAGLMVFPVAWSNTSAGLGSIPKSYLELGAVFELSRWQMLTKITLPHLRSYFNAALITGIGLAWKSGVTAEVLALPKFAIGHDIYNAKIYLETPDLFAWTIIIVILSLLIEGLLRHALNRSTIKRKKVQV